VSSPKPFTFCFHGPIVPVPLPELHLSVPALTWGIQGQFRRGTQQTRKTAIFFSSASQRDGRDFFLCSAKARDMQSMAATGPAGKQIAIAMYS
jgi:hypothetical protein